VRDLLGAPWLQVKEMLPEDAESHRFNKAGEALAISHVQMASYLNAAEYALRQVMVPSLEKPAVTTHRYYARQQGAFAGKLRFDPYTFWAGATDGPKWWVPDRSKTSPGHRDEPVTIYSETVPRILRWLGTFDAKTEPGVSEIDTYLLPGETIRPDAARLYRSR